MRNRATNQLAKAKVRQSWSKYNLYNLSRIAPLPFRTKTQFQQKWAAKSALRAYHGEVVREGQWKRMFSRRLRAVVPMNPEDLAKNDGRKESSGRGMGLEARPQEEGRGGRTRTPTKIPPTPYMQMLFAPLERRLDTAIFRSLFASSTRQARQFVVHGLVKVNGKKINYPGYLLNPGDMFQVDPEMVLFATGAPKEEKTKKPTSAAPNSDDVDLETGAEALAKQAEEEKQKQESEDSEEADPDADDTPRETLQKMLTQAKSILSSPRTTLPAKRKQDLRAFQKAVRRTLSRSRNSTVLTDSLEAQFTELRHQLSTSRDARASSLPSEQQQKATSNTSNEEEEQEEQEEEEEDTHDPEDDLIDASPSELDELREVLSLLRDNPIDPSKPYYTPWRPRDYMSAFTFIPRYLEVNQNICSAVYLRHPVARPGLGEVPTPFMESTSASAFTWYLKRR